MPGQTPIEIFLFDFAEVCMMGMIGAEDTMAAALGLEKEYPAEIGGEPASEFLMRAMRANFKEIRGTADIVRALRKSGYRTGLISDHAREWVEFCKSVFPLDELFDVQCYSFDSGYTKKNPRSFMHALEKMKADPGSTLFVDDNSTNLYIAQQPPVNIRYVHQFTNPSALVSALPAYGVRLRE